MLKEKIFKLEGKVQHYAWGGYDLIPAWLGIENKERKPFAEYWLGVHPLAPSVVKAEQDISLKQFIQSDPAQILSPAVHERFHTLPFLLKLQEVNEVLSIQVHPNKQQAEKGFEEENKANIAIDAPHRNYKDDNHKPEMAVALSEFWLLHGFRSAEEIGKILEQHSSFHSLLPIFQQEGIKGLYAYVMKMTQEEVDKMLLPVVRQNIHDKLSGYVTKRDPAFWIARYFNNEIPDQSIDRGIFSMFFLNIVKLNKGESIFQQAGMLHAYLEGENVELMSNSDNVLRGGLTPKHVDIDELLKLTNFDPVTPQISKGNKKGSVTTYESKVPDFNIAKIELADGDQHNDHTYSLEIHVVLEGEITITRGPELIHYKKGDAYGIIADVEYQMHALTDVVIFKAFVPSNVAL